MKELSIEEKAKAYDEVGNYDHKEVLQTIINEQNPAWSEEDESWFKELELMALSFSNDDSYRKKFFDWLKSLKERITEDKAKRYDEAIERAKSKIKNDKNHVLYEDDIIEIFPELKESEDERIKKP